MTLVSCAGLRLDAAERAIPFQSMLDFMQRQSAELLKGPLRRGLKARSRALRKIPKTKITHPRMVESRNERASK